MHCIPVFCIFLVYFPMPTMLPPPDPTSWARVSRNCVKLLYENFTGPITLPWLLPLHNSAPSISQCTLLYHAWFSYTVVCLTRFFLTLQWLYPNHTLLPDSTFALPCSPYHVHYEMGLPHTILFYTLPCLSTTPFDMAVQYNFIVAEPCMQVFPCRKKHLDNTTTFPPYLYSYILCHISFL